MKTVQYPPEFCFEFPPPGRFPDEPDLCCVTEGMSPLMLYCAYSQGIFPWFDEQDTTVRGKIYVPWYSVNPRFVIKTDELHVPKSIDKFLKHTPYTYTVDKCFDEVMAQCGLMKRKDQAGTWIGPLMEKNYGKFHKDGYAHSFEVWHNGRLAGGFYGVLIGSVFCGESMFTIEPDSSKSAFVIFARRFRDCGGKLIDCQVYTDNMARYNAKEIPREEFLALEKEYLNVPLEKDLFEMYK